MSLSPQHLPPQHLPDMVAQCALCGQDIYRGERGWFQNGKYICPDCFTDFAYTQLLPFAITFGEETNDI